MIRATTPIHKFTFENLNPEDFQVLNAYYAQQGEIILEKEKSDFIFSSEVLEEKTIYTAQVTLSQEETKLFKSRYEVEIQIRALTDTGQSMASQKYKIPVHLMETTYNCMPLIM